MIFGNNNVDPEVHRIQKSVNNNLKNNDYFITDSIDTAQVGVELKPPVSMRDCKYVFDNSSYVAKCCRILAKDLILNNLTLVSEDEENDKVTEKIQENLLENITELYNMLIDYYYAGIGAVEYAHGKHRFTLKQIPINTTKIIRVNIHGYECFLLKQTIQSTTNYFKIMGEEYPEDFLVYDNQRLGECSLLGGDNFYQFFSTPLWVQERDKIFTEIAISSKNYNTISNGNIATGILNVNLEPQLVKPVQYDETGEAVSTKSREELIMDELLGTDSGVAVIFTESNRPISLDYVKLENDNYSYLESLQDKAEAATLNCYNIPLARLMINTEKESMNSNKTQSIWEIYTLDLRTEQSKIKEFIQELIYTLYTIRVDVDIELPIFSDRREIEITNILNEWDKGVLTLRQTIEALSEYTPIIDLKKYDFTIHPDLWDYRQIPGYYDYLNEVDLLKLDEVEAQLDEIKHI